MNRPHINLLIHRLVDAARDNDGSHLDAQFAVDEALDEIEAEIRALESNGDDDAYNAKFRG